MINGLEPIKSARGGRTENEHFETFENIESPEDIANDVAHDLINQLTVIRCWTEVIIRRGLAREKGLEHLRSILTAVDRSVALSEKLLTSCHQSPGGPGAVDLHNAIDDGLIPTDSDAH